MKSAMWGGRSSRKPRVTLQSSCDIHECCAEGRRSPLHQWHSHALRQQQRHADPEEESRFNNVNHQLERSYNNHNYGFEATCNVYWLLTETERMVARESIVNKTEMSRLRGMSDALNEDVVVMESAFSTSGGSNKKTAKQANRSLVPQYCNNKILFTAGASSTAQIKRCSSR